MHLEGDDDADDDNEDAKDEEEDGDNAERPSTLAIFVVEGRAFVFEWDINEGDDFCFDKVVVNGDCGRFESAFIIFVNGDFGLIESVFMVGLNGDFGRLESVFIVVVNGDCGRLESVFEDIFLENCKILLAIFESVPPGVFERGDDTLDLGSSDRAFALEVSIFGGFFFGSTFLFALLLLVNLFSVEVVAFENDDDGALDDAVGDVGFDGLAVVVVVFDDVVVFGDFVEAGVDFVVLVSIAKSTLASSSTQLLLSSVSSLSFSSITDSGLFFLLLCIGAS